MEIKKELVFIGILGLSIIATSAIGVINERASNARQEDNKPELYQNAIDNINSGKYEEAMEILNKLPNDYENTRKIYHYAEYCQELNGQADIKKLNSIVWWFPDEGTYSGEYATEMNTAKKTTEQKYEEYEAAEDEKERKRLKSQTPYGGMPEKFIHDTALGRADKVVTEQYWDTVLGKRKQWPQRRYTWYKNGHLYYEAICKAGSVHSSQEYKISSYSSSKHHKYSSGNNGSNLSGNNRNMDMYDVYDYDDPEDFYYDHEYEFDDIQDAEDYWEENR